MAAERSPAHLKARATRRLIRSRISILLGTES